MCEALVHRGPDDFGEYVEPHLAMGMRRLSIIDIAGGRQPVFNEEKTLALVFNGEIYNYLELRRELSDRGHRFSTQGDAEVILHLYEEKGLALLNDLNGMFAFCLWDIVRGEGVLVRDRLGIKPLYYRMDGRRLVFASEIKALRQAGGRFDLDPSAVHAYLRFMYVPGPATPFDGVKKLPPGSCLRFSPKGIEEPARYWTPYVDGGRHWSREEFLALTDDAVRLQLRSDVPVGIFLSGGIDSSLVTRLATGKLGQHVQAFTVDYRGAADPETGEAASIAAFFGCDHHVVRVGVEDVIRRLPLLLWHMDEPHGDSALVGTYAVSLAAAREVKVVLNGTGGDELFGGYPWYDLRAPLPLHLIQRLPDAGRRLAAGMLRSLRYEGRAELIEWADQPFGLFLWKHFQFKPWETRNFIAGDARPHAPERLLADALNGAPGDPISRMLLADLKFYLTDDLLLLLDKMTMAVSLEGRVPLLDHRLVEWAFRIPGAAKLSGGQGKDLLRGWLKDLVPDAVLSRQKAGFGAPVDAWMRERLFGIAWRLLSRRPSSRQDLFWGLRGDGLRARLATLTPQRVFLLLCLEVWARVTLDGVDPRMDLAAMADL